MSFSTVKILNLLVIGFGEVFKVILKMESRLNKDPVLEAFTLREPCLEQESTLI